MLKVEDYQDVIEALRNAAVVYNDRAYNIRCGGDKDSQQRAKKYDDKSNRAIELALLLEAEQKQEVEQRQGHKVQEAECSVGIREVVGSIPTVSSNLQSLEDHVYPQQRILD